MRVNLIKFGENIELIQQISFFIIQNNYDLKLNPTYQSA